MWYCHNICNNANRDIMNNSIYLRCIPELHLTPILDARPEVRLCNNTQYTSQFSGPVSATDSDSLQSLILNLNPKRPDGYCFFCRIISSLSPNKGNALQYLKKIDIDSFIKGLGNTNSCAAYESLNPSCICNDCHVIANNDPIVVHIINRWNILNTRAPCSKLPITTDNRMPFFFNNISHPNSIPREFSFNNLTKVVSRYDSRSL